MESKNKVAHLVYVPFTGLGLYGGHRGKRWLKNRIQIFKQFVVSSLLAQTNKDFIVWVSWRHEDRNCPLVKDLKKYLEFVFPKVVFTYSGVLFWDDKYPDEVAYERLVNAVRGSMGDLLNVIGEADTVLMTIQPSDDCYHKEMVEEIQEGFSQTDYQVLGYKKGYVMDYKTFAVAEWNPETTPPFYTIKFPRETFMDAHKHVKYIGPYKSHEYVKDFLKAKYDTTTRGFTVGTHGENISTVFNHPYARVPYTGLLSELLARYGLDQVKPLKVAVSIRKQLLRKLPHGWQRKLRYVFGERLFARVYNWLRA